MRRRGAKCWCARDDTGAWRSNTVVARSAGEKSPRPRSGGFSMHRPARRARVYRFQSKNGSGCRQQTIRGIKRSGARRRSDTPSGPPAHRARCWPGPPLRPKRSALRAPQGCAPHLANKNGDAVGRARSESSFLGLLTRNFSKETARKEKRDRTQKGDISNGVRKGTFLSSFDTSHPLSLTVSPRRCRVRLLGPNPALPDRRRNVCLSAEPFGPWLSWCVSQLPSPSRLRGIISTSTPSK